MACRSFAGGKPTYKVLSKRPGRSTAGSMISEPDTAKLSGHIGKDKKMCVKMCVKSVVLPGRLVAAMIKTCRRVSNPSISVSSWFTTRSLAPD